MPDEKDTASEERNPLYESSEDLAEHLADTLAESYTEGEPGRTTENLARATARYRQETALLREVADDLRRSLMEAPYPIMLLNLHGEILMLNRAWLQLTGYERDELQTVEDWIGLAFPEMTERKLREWETIKKEQRPFDQAREIVTTRDGRKLIWQSRTAPLRMVQDPKAKFITVAADLTEQVKANKNLDRFFGLSSDMLCMLDLEGRFRRINQALVDGLQYPEEKVLSLGLLDLVHEEDVQATEKFLARLKEGEVPLHFENRIRSADGSYRNMVWSANPIIEDQVIFAGAHDITDLRTTTLQLQKMTEDLIHSNEELGKFASVASHDLREPIRTVVTFTQLLGEEYGDQLDEQGREYMDFIIGAATRSQKLIRDLLEYSRVDSKAHPFELVDSRELMKEILLDFHFAVEESGADVQVGELPWAVADRTQLKQVLQNLLNNALKFKRAGVPLVIRVGAERSAGSWIFRIEDNGTGIAPEYHGRIFEIFQRLHGERYPGTGIGLAICKRVIERHKGRIWVESQLGEGSAFMFSLPIPNS